METSTRCLPEALITRSGEPVETPEFWERNRRVEVLQLFTEQVYGRAPEAGWTLDWKVQEEATEALEGRAIRKQVILTLTGEYGQQDVDVLLYLPPAARTNPVPVFCGLNFLGNHTIHPDPGIVTCRSPLPGRANTDERGRGDRRRRYAVERILERGYGLVTACYGDIDPDFPDDFKNGVHGIFDPPGSRGPDSWGSVAAWAWGLSRILDGLASEPLVDTGKVAAVGHSRLGKTALWAAARDPRFAMAISNDSGCTGAAYARNKKVETVEMINRNFPHWFCENYKQYADREEDLPVDQHLLLALMAPRPVYVASASEDEWASPESEFQSCLGAGPVYRLYGQAGLLSQSMPRPGEACPGEGIGYHLREGAHDMRHWDWERFLDFADQHLP